MRSYAENSGLAVVAERMVREGYSRAEVSRLLKVPAQTLAGWALRYGWRKKDIEQERADAALGRMIDTVNGAREAVLEKRAAQAEQWRLFRETIGRIRLPPPDMGPGPGEGESRGAGRIDELMAWVEAMPRLEGPGLEGRPEAAVRNPWEAEEAMAPPPELKLPPADREGG